MVTRILVPFDGSPAARRAVELVASYAGDPAALAVRLLNVQARPFTLWPRPSAAVGAIEGALVDAGRNVLAGARQRLQRAGIPVEEEVQLGLAASAIPREAEACQAELIVMGTRGSGPLQGYALGSIAMRVAHSGAAPVLLVKPDDRLPAALGKRLRVLVAMDGSPPAVRAVERLASSRAWLGDLEVHLVHVQQPLTTLQAVLPPHDDLLRQWSTEEGEQATESARGRLMREGIAHKIHYTVGDPALEVRQLAQQTSSEVVALGTRGLGAAHHALVGSVALKAAIAVDVPVLLCA